jgi:hypothetical protein
MNPNDRFPDVRLTAILTGVGINLIAGLMVLLLAKYLLPESITSWRVWLALLISVLAVGTVVWLGVTLRMELKALQAEQQAVADLVAGMHQGESETSAVREQLMEQIGALAKRIDEASAGMTSSLNALEEAKQYEAAAARKQMLDQVGALAKRIDAGSTQVQSLVAGLQRELAALRAASGKSPAGQDVEGPTGGAVRIIPPAAPKPELPPAP